MISTFNKIRFSKIKYGLYFVFAILLIACAFYNQKIAKKILSIDFIEQRLSKNIPDKIWLHRCNSKQRLAIFHNKYYGVEIDIIYYDNLKKFESSHDPEDPESNNLEQIFRYYAENKLTNKMWLDFKNLSAKNQHESEEALSKLIDKYGIYQKNIIIESKDWRALRYYKDSGYQTSYYFPYYRKEQLNDVLKKDVEEILQSGNANYISLYYEYYNFIKELNIPNEIKLLTWADGSRWHEIAYLNKFHEIMNDKDLVVILSKETKDWR